MKNNPFSTLTPMEPRAGLYSLIISKISRAQRQKVWLDIAISGIAAFVSTFALIVVTSYAAQEFYQSGFSLYASLLFSDPLNILSFWKEFALSLVESLPALEVAVVLVTLSALVGSLSLAIKNMKPVFYSMRLIN